MIRKCFNEEVKASTKTAKLTDLLSGFFTTFSFCVFYNRSLYCFNLLFFSGKSGWLWKEAVAEWLWKEPVVEWCGKWSRRQRHMRCSKWPLSAWRQVSSLVRHRSMIHHSLLELTQYLNQLLSQIEFLHVAYSDILRWSGQTCTQLVSHFLGSLCTKNYWNRFIFDRFISKIKRRRGHFWDTV